MLFDFTKKAPEQDHYSEKEGDNMPTDKRYDVGIVGWWYNLNYGGTLTYYALNRAVQSLGRSVLMIQRSCPKDYTPETDTVPMRFAQKHYNISERYSFDELPELNKQCSAFIAGSDQLWNPHLAPWSGPEYFLSFGAPDRVKLAYATSFGNIEHCKDDFINKYKPLLQQFDGITVREDYAVNICKTDFDMPSMQVCDPVFLCDPSEYRKLAKDSDRVYPKKYVLNFLLDPDEQKLDVCRFVRDKLAIQDSVNFTDLQHIEEHTKAFGGEKVCANYEIEDFVKAYTEADFVVTDSFHGTCLAVLLNKPFISLANKVRGEKRFISVLNWLQLMDRLVFDPKDVYTKQELFNRMSFEKTNRIIAEGKEKGLNWLKTSLERGKTPEAKLAAEVQTQEIEALQNNPDFRKIRILATLFRDYGIKHVVLSPGGRDVPLVRMFEYNEESFILHRVTDERSAAYFGLGLAAQLQKPVACVCTSGTAASNFLPAVTEAFYTGVPLIVVTADRCSVYHEQGEDQTIPQQNIYRDVVKKEVTLPEGSGYYPEYQARRDISDCILEATHNGLGPVHINVTVDNIMIGARVPRTYWKLLPHINPHILRVTVNEGEAKMMRWVDALKKSPRILIAYGQNPPPTEKQRKNIERFAAKFNCVIVTDFLSNLDCSHSLKPYNMLQAISQTEFNQKLAPDIMITVGGKFLMNDPLMYKVRGGPGWIRHWSVREDGKIKDLYFRLSSVIEASQDYFFEFFADHAGDSVNNGEYYQAWKQLCDQHRAPVIKKFNSHYVQSKFIPAVPANSLLHLAVGQSFYDTRRYTLDKSVEVFCNMGTNGIDGCTSTFMGQCAVVKDKLCFLLVGDLSFFYDMNSIWNKQLNKNMRIMLVNNNGTDLLRGHNLQAISSVHNTEARGWVETVGFEYLSARTQAEYDKKLEYFLSTKPNRPVFFEVFAE